MYIFFRILSLFSPIQTPSSTSHFRFRHRRHARILEPRTRNPDFDLRRHGRFEVRVLSQLFPFQGSMERIGGENEPAQGQIGLRLAGQRHLVDHRRNLQRPAPGESGHKNRDIRQEGGQILGRRGFAGSVKGSLLGQGQSNPRFFGRRRDSRGRRQMEVFPPSLVLSHSIQTISCSSSRINHAASLCRL